MIQHLKITKVRASIPVGVVGAAGAHGLLGCPAAAAGEAPLGWEDFCGTEQVMRRGRGTHCVCVLLTSNAPKLAQSPS